MTELSVLHVVDTAVKIGLGAAIAGISAYFVARHNHSSELSKLRYLRRLDAIEGIASVTNKHFSVLDIFLGYISRAIDEMIPGQKEFSPQNILNINKYDDEFMKQLSSLNEAADRLLLLGETRAHEEYKKYNNRVGEFRNKLILKGYIPTTDDFDKLSKDLDELRTNINKELCIIYLKIDD